MSFYNPSIQSCFESDQFQFIIVKDYLVASYSILHHVKSEYSLLSMNDIIDAFQLDFIKFLSYNQQKNFSLISQSFHLLVAEIALNVLFGKISSFDSYLQSNIDSSDKIVSLKAIFLREYIIEFIEYLVFTNIGSTNLCDGTKDFSILMGKTLYNSMKFPVFYNLYDRLKLYDRLQREFILEVNQKSLIGSDFILNFTIRI